MRKVQEQIFEFFCQFLHYEIAPNILPSVQQFIKTYKSISLEEEPESEENVFEHILSRLDKSQSNSYNTMLLKTNSVNKVSSFLAIFSAMKKLPSSKFNSQLLNILLEILKLPDSSIQLNCLNLIKKAKKTSDIFNDYFKLFTDLIDKTNFKGNLLTLKSKVKTLESLEKRELMPIANALLYRKLVDKKGTGNFKNLSSIRDFVLDTISDFRAEELDKLIETMFMTFGIDIKDKNCTIDMHTILKYNPTSKVVGLLETLNNIIKKLGLEIKGHLPFIQRFILEASKVSFEFQSYFKEEKAKVIRGSGKSINLSLRQMLIITAENEMKSLKQACLARIKDIYANFIELDLSEFTTEFCAIQKSIISTMHLGSYQKLPKIFSVFGCWSECEMYKSFFIEHPEVLGNLIQLISTPKLTVQTFEYVTDLIRRISSLNVSDHSSIELGLAKKLHPHIKDFKLPQSENVEETGIGFKLINPQDDRKFTLMSKIGCKIIKQNLGNILECLSRFTELMQSNKKLQNMTKSQKRRAELVMSEFSMFMAFFCESESSYTQKFISIVSKFWDVEKFNKITDVPQSRIRTAEELVSYEKEIEYQSNLLGLMANLACKVEDIDSFYSEVYLKFLSKLGHKTLRKVLGQIAISLSSNKKFFSLGLDNEIFLKIADLLGISKRNSLTDDTDYNGITQFLVESCNHFQSLSLPNQELVACASISWARTEELGLREKSLEYLQIFIQNLPADDRSILLRYKQNILDTAVGYFRSHYGKEGQIKSAIKILVFNTELGARVSDDLLELPYLDLSDLTSQSNKKKLKNQSISFLEHVLDLKLNLRQRAFMLVEDKIKNEGLVFSTRTVKNIFQPLGEYFAFEFWNENSSATNAYSEARVDRAKQAVLSAIKVYGMTTGMLTFPQFIQFLKNLIFQIGRPFRNQETVLKLVCSCLDNISSEVTDVLGVINSNYRTKNEESLKNSIINQVLQTYHDAQEMNKGRLTSAYEEYDYQQEKVLADAANQIKESSQADKLGFESEAHKMDIEEDPENEDADDNEEIEDLGKDDLPVLVIEEPEDEDAEDDEILMAEEKLESSLTQNQQMTLKRKVLLPLKKHLLSIEGDQNNDKKTRIRSDVAIAIIKLIRIFPIQSFNQELIGTLHSIGKCLRAKDEPSRTEARKTLCSILRELGPFFLGFVVKELKFSLTLGFEVHTRNFTLFQLLETLIDMRGQTQMLEKLQREDDQEEIDPFAALDAYKVDATPKNLETERNSKMAIEIAETQQKVNYGEIDYCIGDIAEMVLDEVAGNLAKEKEVTEIKSRTKEFKGNKGLESFRMMAILIDFKSNAMNHVIDKLEQVFQRENLNYSLKKFDELFNFLILGLSENPTVTKDALFLWTISMNKKAISALMPSTTEADADMIPEKRMIPDELKRNNMERTFKIQEGAAKGESIWKLMTDKRDVKTKPFGRILCNFSLNLFYRKLRSPLFQIDFSDAEIKSQISEYMNPLIDQLVTLMSSDISKLMQISLSIVAHVLNWPVWSMENKGKKMLRLILRIFDKLGSSDADLVESCFKMIKKIILTNKEFLANSQISSIYDMLQDNLFKGDSYTESIECLNALISQKLFKEKLYDILDEIFSGMVKNPSQKIRKLCKLVMENFIENAPISENLIEKFLMKLVNNLNFESAEGRYETTDLLLKFVVKFPVNLIAEHIDVMLLGVITSIVNEQNFSIKQKMKVLASQLILNMIAEEMNQKLDSFIKFSENFLQSTKTETKRAGIVLIESMFSAGLRDNRIKSKLKFVLGLFEQTSSQIGSFYINIKEEKELNEQLRHSAWKDLLIGDGANAYLLEMKDSKNLMIDALFFVSSFINSGEFEQEELEECVKSMLEIRNHPDEDIRLLLTDMLSHLFSLEELKSCLKDNLKAIMLLLFANLRGEDMKEPVFASKCQLIILVLYFEFGAEIEGIRTSFFTAMDSLVSRSLKFHKKGLSVFKKVVSTFEFLLTNHQSGISQDESQQMLNILLRLQLNGNVAQDKDLIVRIEVVSFLFFFEFWSFWQSKDVQIEKRPTFDILVDRRHESCM